MSGRRKELRVPLITQVEERRENFAALGRAENVSVGGLSVETRDTLNEGATVVVRFSLPGEPRPIEAAGRVVWVEPSKAMGINFLGLLESQRKKIQDYVNNLPESSAEAPLAGESAGEGGRRRTARLPRRIPLILIWQDEEGHPQQEAAETVLLSQYGAMVLSFTPMQPGQLVWISVPSMNKKELSRVVWVKTAATLGRVEIGLEILGDKDFWEIEFPPAAAETVEPPKRGQRRSARLARVMGVVLSWRDELGRAREELGHTRLLSKHGALVSSPVSLLVNQQFHLRVPQLQREALARVVHASPGELPGQTDLGIEFFGVADFWGIAFPADTPPAEPLPGATGSEPSARS